MNDSDSAGIRDGTVRGAAWAQSSMIGMIWTLIKTGLMWAFLLLVLFALGLLFWLPLLWVLDRNSAPGGEGPKALG